MNPRSPFAWLFLCGISLTSTVSALEVCGLRDANIDTIFFDGFSPPISTGGLGPPAHTVQTPQTGIQPTVTVLWPPPGATVPSGALQVMGTVTGPVNTGVLVSGVRAYVDDGVFLTPPFALDSAATSVTVTATTLDGLTAQSISTVSVSSTAQNFSIASDESIGYSPFPVRFHLTVDDSLLGQPLSMDVDFNGDGVYEYSGSFQNVTPIFTYDVHGVYEATVVVRLANGSSVAASQKVMVLSIAEQRAAICSAYAHLRNRLLQQDASGAGQSLMKGLRNRLMPLFEALSTQMPDVAGRLGILADGFISLDSAEIVTVRDLDVEIRGYPTLFSRDYYGVWRIDSM